MNLRVCLGLLWGRGGPSVTRTKTRAFFFFFKSNSALLATLNGYFSDLATGGAGGAGAAGAAGAAGSRALTRRALHICVRSPGGKGDR